MSRTTTNISIESIGGFVLLLALSIVYILFFSLEPIQPVSLAKRPTDPMVIQQIIPSTEPETIDSSIHSPNNALETDTVGQSIQESGILEVASKKTEINPGPTNTNIPPTPSYIVSTNTLFGINETTNTSVPTDSGIIPLSNTHHRKGVMKSASLMGFQDTIQYILKNNDNTHFAFLGSMLPDIAETIDRLHGKTVAFTNKNDIVAQGLWGDQIIFLQIPQYIGKKQLFFVYFEKESHRWYIQVDNDIFETTKPLLRELFAKRYNR